MKLLALFSLFILGTVQAGHETGDGGGVLVCNQGFKKNVELLDFWEGEVFWNLEIREDHSSIPVQVNEALRVLGNFGAVDLSDEATVIFNDLYRKITKFPKEVFLPKGVGIMAPEDARNQYVKKLCQHEGAALYNDISNTLELDGDNYFALTKTRQAGLLAPEAVYKVLRDKFDIRDSRLARYLTACAFATTPCPELNPRYEIPDGKEKMTCISEGFIQGKERLMTKAIIFPRLDLCLGGFLGKVWRIQILQVNQEDLPVRSFFDVCPNFDLAALVKGTGAFPKNQDFTAHQPLRSSFKTNKDVSFPMSVDFTANSQGMYLNGYRMKCSKN